MILNVIAGIIATLIIALGIYTVNATEGWPIAVGVAAMVIGGYRLGQSVARIIVGEDN